MASKLPIITKENSNFFRLCKLLIDGGTHALKVIFDGKHPPHDLKKHLSDSKRHNILKNLKAKKLLRPEQWKKLYPSVGSATSAGFDITLLSLLLRNICNLPTPANGWDKEPAATSVNEEDDVVRLRLYRNNLYGHISEPALSDADFNKYWNDIETVLLRHGVDKTAIDSLKTQSFEPEDEDYYIKCLKEWITDEADRVINAVKRVLEEIENVKDKLDELKLEPSKPPATDEDMKLYSENLKKTIIKQTELNLQPKEIKQEMKTDDIFTNLIVHHGEKRRPESGLPEQIQSPQKGYPGRKTLTEIKQCSKIFVDEDEKDTTAKRILLSGEPGVGKTLFSQKLLRDLATNSISIPGITFTYLLTFRQLNNLPNETLDLRELLNLSPLLNDETMIDENVMEYILQHSEQLLIVLDGFDEYKDSNKILGDFESQFPNDSKTKKPVAALLSKLIRKQILQDAVIMITSRLGEAIDLTQKFYFDRYVEISGFSESQVIEYVEKYFSTKPEEVKNLALRKVKESVHYISFGRVPFRCLLMCIVIEWKIKKHDDSCPLTLTELFCEVIQCIEETDYNRAADDKASSVRIDKTLDNFSKLAAQLAKDNRFSFTLQDLENLGLTKNESLHMKSSSLIIFCYPVSHNSPFKKPACEYSFTHFTIQEFFVARYLVEKGEMPGDKTGTEMVYIFMSGLLGSRKLKNKELMEKLLECLGKHIRDKDRLRLVSLRCLHEFGEESLTGEQLTANRDSRYWRTYVRIELHGVTDTDCDAIAKLAESTATSSSTARALSIVNSSITVGGLEKLLRSLHDSIDIAALILWGCGLDDECAKWLSTEYFHGNTKITELDLSANEISNDGVIDIMENLPSNLTVLYLSWNKISDKGVEHIMEHFPNQLTKLHLGSNNISDECKKKMKQICKKENPDLRLDIR
ncbi:NACHT, LRR and PYD domains-containing protein 14 [Exaiptasia diaphana]|uniref:NACHT domain-containing protein n=1 Tax=Exaiptasia diaphana TaxID=2652724 RepID=A0A913Y0S1_EXADI|nr:NACHT, LRR and PYD domains-containing protein 14 [Exaiptasia diaphana]